MTALTLLGTASLVEVNRLRLLVDAGAGVVRRLAHIGLAVGDSDITFLTHLHDDHTAALTEFESPQMSLGHMRAEHLSPAVISGTCAVPPSDHQRRRRWST
jgi:ribonuclease BN (tRNA processing enzyme)